MSYEEAACRRFNSHTLFQLWKKGWNARAAGRPIVANVARSDAGRIAWERGWTDRRGRENRRNEQEHREVTT